MFQSLILNKLTEGGITYTVHLHAYELDYVNAKRSRETNVKVEDPKDWKLFQPDHSLVERQDDFDANFNFNEFLQGKKNAHTYSDENTKNLIRQLMSLKKCYSLVRSSYDFYLLSRLDLLYRDNKGLMESIHDVASNSSQDILYTPSWNTSKALNDRIAICNKSVASIYCNRIDNLNQVMKKRVSIHSETILMDVANLHNLTNKTFPFYAARMRADGRLEAN